MSFQIENECNGALVLELEACLNEKENLIKNLLAQEKCDKSEIERIKSCSLKWKEELQNCKKLLKQYQVRKSEIENSQKQFYQV